jgi:predicted RNA-binding protein YlqC (UPF0109 family)
MGFFGKKDIQQNGTELSSASTSPASKAIENIEHFVDYVVRILVDKPDAIGTKIKKGENEQIIIMVSCDKSDMGKVIGKNGKTIMAIRSLASNAGTRAGIRLSVELAE